jgi:hypothetical protein
MDRLIKIIRILEIIGFLIANFAVAILLYQYIDNASFILYILAIVATTIILKIQWFISSKDASRITGAARPVNASGDFSSGQSTSVFANNLVIPKIPWIKFSIITVKQMFYNTLFELFPVLVIWLCVFGLAYFVGGWFTFTVKNSQSFFGIVTLFGIVLGIFQYYLQRHEDKIAGQISFYANQIINTINEETNFQNFYKKIEQMPAGHDGHEHDGYEVQKWVERRIDQKYRLIDLLKELIDDKDRRQIFFDLIKSGTYESVITIKEDIPTSDMHFEMIELYAKGGEMHEKLLNTYRWYFDDAKRIEEIYSKLTDQIEIDGFTKLVLGNINIIQETLPLFVNEKFKKFFEQSLRNQDFSQFEPQSAREFRSLLIFKLYNRIMVTVLS